MTASYPGAVKDFAANVDGATLINASYMDQRDEEIEAIEGAIGIRPWGGAYGMFKSLLGLRGFWPMSSLDENGNPIDLSGQGRTLTANNGPTFDLLFTTPYAVLDGSDDYFSRTSEAGLNVNGNEAYIATAYQGITVGGWFWANSLASAGYFMAKDDLSDRSYGMYHSSSNVRFGVFDDSATYFEVASAGTISINTWYFLVGRVDIDSGTRSIFVNAVETVDSSLPPPTEIHEDSADFSIGARSNADAFLNGRAALCFLCASALPNTTIETLFSQTRRRFGV